MKLIFEHKEAKLWYDSEFRILKAVWYGEVSLDAFQSLVLKGSEVLRSIEAVHLIFDRSKLDNFTAEARVWFKHDFMSKEGEGRKLIKKVRKLAAVKGASILGQITSSMVGKVLLLFNPRLNYKIFEDERNAEGWTKSLPLLSKESIINQNITQKRGLFRFLFR